MTKVVFQPKGAVFCLGVTKAAAGHKAIASELQLLLSRKRKGKIFFWSFIKHSSKVNAFGQKEILYFFNRTKAIF